MRTGRCGRMPADLSSLKEAMADNRVWAAVGVVRARDGGNSHFEIVTDDEEEDVLVDVDLGPDGTPGWCRLGSHAGRAGGGIWRVPPPDTEVIVVMTSGDPRDMPAIVATLSSGTLPENVDGDALLVVNTKKVRILSTEDDVAVDASGGGKKVLLQGGGKGVARLDDTTTNGTLAIVGGVSTAFAGLLYTAPDGTTTTISTAGPVIPIAGKINSASSKTESG